MVLHAPPSGKPGRRLSCLTRGGHGGGKKRSRMRRIGVFGWAWLGAWGGPGLAEVVDQMQTLQLGGLGD